ncbi:hypothetical protein [Bradyrhizobium sp. RDI18]|uniref:hypothetical protein n=1 Tax=Bradyrhizobium sp. RDI18 TaxID=3367400 RepID=UPI003711B46A
MVASISYRRLPPILCDRNLISWSPSLYQPVRAAKNATSEIPIVMLFVADPVGWDLCVKPGSPWRKSDWCRHAGSGRFRREGPLAFFGELWPQAKRVAAFSSILQTTSIGWLSQEFTYSAADQLGFQLDIIEMRKAEEIPGAIAAAKARGAESFIHSG